MKITIKHYFLIFLILLLAVVLIRNYKTSSKSKPLPPAKELKSSQPESLRTRKQSKGLSFQSSGFLDALPPVDKGEKNTDRNVSGLSMRNAHADRENPFEPLIQPSPESGKLTNELSNHEEVAPNNPNKKRTQLVRLVGVIADDTPVAILEVGDTSYILSIGDSVAEMEVAKIRSDEIVLIAEGEEWTIKLEEE